jgi:hypothetical protein
MAYVYICDKCRDGEHGKCEVSQNIPKDMMPGGGHCICSHGPEKGKFEQNVWERDK